MRCIITAGPTFEPLDDVRRLTNFSTGRLGCQLAAYLTERGHEVRLLLGEQATYTGELKAARVQRFTTTANLQGMLEAAGEEIGAIFHAAAVSDFSFGKIWLRSGDGELSEVKSSKITTREGTLLAELVPTPKLILQMRKWFPDARIVGWKFETEGGRQDALDRAMKQMTLAQSDACVANGPAYGQGFGLLTRQGLRHLKDMPGLFEALEALMA
jgi:phosphopantothenoylcysteine synthetase/decarboxylase